jgi:hypothetical protein
MAPAARQMLDGVIRQHQQVERDAIDVQPFVVEGHATVSPIRGVAGTGTGTGTGRKNRNSAQPPAELQPGGTSTARPKFRPRFGGLRRRCQFGPDPVILGAMVDPEPWVNRPHPGPRGKPLPLSRKDRAKLEAAMRPATAEKRVVRRAEAALLMAAGVSVRDTGQALGADPRTVERWRKRFLTAETIEAALADAPRSGRPRALSRRGTQRA